MSVTLTLDDLEALRQISTPTICNTIEVFNVRPRSAGFFNNEIKCVFPGMGTMVGFAATATMRAERPDYNPETLVNRWRFWNHTVAQPTPRIAVIEDLDDPVAQGSFWGEVQGNTFKALGAIGCITNGGVRDLDEAEAMGFQFYASHVIPSHAYVHVVEVGIPVKVGGIVVRPGDLLHADKHGITTIPIEVAKDIPKAAKEIEAKERKIISLCQSNKFSTEKLWDLLAGGKPVPPK